MEELENVLSGEEVGFMESVKGVLPEPQPELQATIAIETSQPDIADAIQQGLVQAAQSKVETVFGIDQSAVEDMESLNPFYGVRANASPQQYGLDMSEAYSIIGGQMVGRYDAYRPGVSNEEIHAMTQSNSEKFSRGMKKFGYGVGTAAMGGTIGSVTGLIKAVSEWDMDALGSDAFNTWLREKDQISQERLANYSTQAESELNFLQSIGTANFLTNDLPQGATFLIGNLLSEGLWAYATGGGSLFTAPARAAFRSGGFAFRASNQTARTAAAMRAAKGEAMQMARFSTLGRSASATTTLGRVGQFANATRYMYTSASYEAALESNMMQEEAKKAFNQYYIDNRITPEAEDYINFRETLDAASRASYWANLALVGTTNLALYGSIFNIKNPLSTVNKKVRDKVFGVGLTRKSGELVARQASGLQRLGGWTYRGILRPAFHEGIKEEGLQASIETGASSWIAQTYDEEAGNDIAGMWDALLTGVGETYTSKEGWKEIGIGMIVGILGGSFSGGLRGYSRERRAYQGFVDEALSKGYTSEQLFDRYTNWTRANKFAKNYRESEVNGDHAGMRSAERDMMLNHIVFYDRYGMKDEMMSDMRWAMENTDNAEMAEELGISEAEVQDMKNSFMSELSDRTTQYSKYKEFADIMVGEGPLPKHLNSNRGKEELSTAIAYNLTRGKDSWKDLRNAHENLRDYVLEISGIDVSDYLDMDEALGSATERTAWRYTNKAEEFDKVQRRVDKLEDLVEQHQTAVLNSTENTRQVTSDRLIGTQTELLGLRQEMDRLREELTILEESIIAESSPYAEGEEVISGLNAQTLHEITLNDGTTVISALEPIHRLLQQLEQTNPEAYRVLSERLMDYKNAGRNHSYFNETIKGLSSPEFHLPTYATKLGFSIFGNKSINEFTAEFVNRMFESQMVVQPMVDVQVNEAISNMEEEILEERRNREIEEEKTKKITPLRSERWKKKWEIEDITEPRLEKWIDYGRRQIRALESEITVLEMLIKEGEVDDVTELQREVDDIKVEVSVIEDRVAGFENRQRELDVRIEELQNQIDALDAEIESIINDDPATSVGESATELERVENMIRDILDDVTGLRHYVPGEPANLRRRTREELEDVISRRTELIGRDNLTEEEQVELEDLNSQLHEDYVVDNYVYGEVTLGDLLDRRDQLKATQAEQRDSTVFDTKSTIETRKASENTPGTTTNTKDMVQTPEGVYMRIERGVVQIRHLTVKGFIRSIGQNVNSVVYTNSEGNAIDVTNEALTGDIAHQLDNTEGGTYTITTPDGSYDIKLGSHARLELSEESWGMLEDSFDIKFMESPADPQRNVNSRGYNIDSQGNVREAKTDFMQPTDTPNAPPRATAEESYNTEEVTFHLDTGDRYNKGLIEDYNSSDKTPEDKKKLVDNVKVYVVSKGKVVGNLRAGTDGINSSDSMNNYLILRTKAAEGLIGSPSNTMVDLNMSTRPQYIFPGSPIFKFNYVNEQLELTTETATAEDLHGTIDFGYVRNGQAVLKGDTELDSRSLSYIPRDNKRRPVIAKRVGGRVVLFPVGIPQQIGSIADEVKVIVDSQDRLGRKITRINSVLLANGILPSQYSLSESEMTDPTYVDGLIEELAERTGDIDMDSWMRDNTIDSLEGTIVVPIQEIGHPKIKLDLVGIRENAETVTTTVEVEASIPTVEQIEVSNQGRNYTIRRTASEVVVDNDGVITSGVEVLLTHKNGTTVSLKEGGKAYERVIKANQDVVKQLTDMVGETPSIPQSTVRSEKNKKC